MTEEECYQLLRFENAGRTDTVMTIESLTDAITRSIECNMMDQTQGIRESKPLFIGGVSIMFKKDNGLLLLFVNGDGYLEISEDSNFAFRVLSVEGMLRDVVDSTIVDELERLRNEVVEARVAANAISIEERERAELERLRQKYG